MSVKVTITCYIIIILYEIQVFGHIDIFGLITGKNIVYYSRDGTATLILLISTKYCPTQLNRNTMSSAKRLVVHLKHTTRS